MDVKTMTDIVKPIASALAVAVAPVHLELITVAAGKYDIAVVMRFNYYVINLMVINKVYLPLLTSAFPVIFPQTTLLTANTHVSLSVDMSVQVILV